MWLVMLNHVRSWLYASWFEILHGFSGLPVLYGFKYDVLITPVIALYSYKLVGSDTAGIRARFNIEHVICVFKTMAFI